MQLALLINTVVPSPSESFDDGTPRALDSLRGGELFRHYLEKYRYKYTKGLASLIAVDLIDLVGPLLVAKAIDTVADCAEGALTKPEALRMLVLCAGAYLLIHIVMGILRYLWRVAFIGTSFLIDRDLKTTFFSKLLKLSTRFFGKNPTGDLMSRATNDHEAVRMSLGIGTLIFLDALVYLAAVPALMLYLNWKLTLFILLPLPLLPVVVVRVGKAIEQGMEKVQAGFSKLSAVVQEAFSGIRVVKGYVREEAEEAKFEAASRHYVASNLRLARAQMLMAPLMQYSVNIGLVILVFAGGQQVLAGALSVGTWVALQRYISRLAWPMVAIGWSITLNRRGQASAKRILEIINQKPDLVDADDPAAEPPIWRGEIVPKPGEIRFDEKPYPPLTGCIEIRDLSFSFVGGAAAIEHMNLTIAPGETVALVGKIGSGKSTLVQLLARLYPVDRGRLYIDGRDINDIPLKQLRDSIGFVPQEPFLFSDTIARNVSMGIRKGGPTAENEARYIAQALEAAGLSREVDRLPRGTESLLGERGINLSGGQKQRLTLARALVREPPIVIFDDTLSAVDAKTEEVILDRLLSFAQRRTAILISHRLSAAQRADRVLVLDKGRLVEQGTHASLVQKGGLYAELYRKQQLEAALEAEATGGKEVVA